MDIDRRSFLNGAGRFAAGALTATAAFEMMRPNDVWAWQMAKQTQPASARLVDKLRTSFTFQISVDVATVEQGLGVASAALAGGATIVEMGTPLLKNAGVSNVVPAFRRKFPEALLLADMKTMDGGGFEARAVYAGGGNIVDFLALAGVDTAKAICAVRDEFRRTDGELPRLAFADIMVPHQGPAAQAIEVAQRMLEAGVDGVGVHLQADARRADPKLIESHYLDDMARAIFEKVGSTAPVQVVGGLTVAQAKSLAQTGLRAFVISGNLGQPDTRARYDLPGDQIERHVADFIAAVSASSAQSPSSGLAETSWQLVKFQGSDGTTRTPDDRGKYTIAFAAGQLSTRVDCNRGRGTWQSSGENKIEFSPLALTRARCPEGSLHDQIVKHWTEIGSYALKGGHLFLSVTGNGGTYEFEPAPKTK